MRSESSRSSIPSPRHFLEPMLLLLCVLVAVRGVTLELSSFIEPTEPRYAYIAAQMVVSGDWLSPRLWVNGELVDYFSKPPLHFWTTASFFSLFGLDEWVARLPSFLAYLGTLVVVFFSARSVLGRTAAFSASVIAGTALLFFGLGGGSVVDVTLTLYLSIAWGGLVFLIRAESPAQRRWIGRLICVAVGLSVLVKGPLPVALIGMSGLFLVWRFGWQRVLGGFPWISGTMLFCAVVLPWFILQERAHPGFLEYYLLQENLGRYFSKDFGSRYGRGHQYPYGASWVLTVVAFLPWTPLLAGGIAKHGRALLSRSTDGALLWAQVFLFFGLSSTLLFSFSKNFLATYLVYGMPWLGAALVALVFADATSKGWVVRVGRILEWVLLVSGVVALAAAFVFGVHPLNGLIGLLVVIFLLALVMRRRSDDAPVLRIGTAAVLVYAIVLTGLGPVISERRSCEELLRYAASQLPPESVIAVTTYYNQAPYWLALAWKKELPKPIRIARVAIGDVLAVRPKELVIASDEAQSKGPELAAGYDVVARIGEWVWLRARDSGAVPLT